MQEPIRSLEGYHAMVPSRSPAKPRRNDQRRFSMEDSTDGRREDDTQPPPERSEDLRVSPPLEDEVGGRIDITA